MKKRDRERNVLGVHNLSYPFDLNAVFFAPLQLILKCTNTRIHTLYFSKTQLVIYNLHLKIIVMTTCTCADTTRRQHADTTTTHTRTHLWASKLPFHSGCEPGLQQKPTQLAGDKFCKSIRDLDERCNRTQRRH